MNHRDSKSVIRVPLELDREVFEMLERFCARAGRTRKAVISHAIIDHVEQPVRPIPSMLEEIAMRKKLGRLTLENDPAKLSRREKARKKRG